MVISQIPSSIPPNTASPSDPAVFGLALAVLSHGDLGPCRGADGQASSGGRRATDTCVYSTYHTLPLHRMIVGIVISESGEELAYRYTPPL